MALITMPGVQNPHCSPWHSLNAACIGCIVPSACGEPLDGDDGGAVGLGREHVARLDGAAVEMDRARAALAGIAAHVRAGQREMGAQEFDQQRPRIDLRGHGLAVDGQCKLDGHVYLLRVTPRSAEHVLGAAGSWRLLQTVKHTACD